MFVTVKPSFCRPLSQAFSSLRPERYLPQKKHVLAIKIQAAQFSEFIKRDPGQNTLERFRLNLQTRCTFLKSVFKRAIIRAEK